MKSTQTGKYLEAYIFSERLTSVLLALFHIAFGSLMLVRPAATISAARALINLIRLGIPVSESISWIAAVFIAVGLLYLFIDNKYIKHALLFPFLCIVVGVCVVSVVSVQVSLALTFLYISWFIVLLALVWTPEIVRELLTYASTKP